MIVFVEHSVLDDPLLAGAPAWAGLESKVQTFTDGKDDLTDKIDFIVCLGGDGTLLYASSLFQVRLAGRGWPEDDGSSCMSQAGLDVVCAQRGSTINHTEV